MEKSITPDAAIRLPTISDTKVAAINIRQPPLLANHPSRKNPTKLPGTPATKLSKGFDSPTLLSTRLPRNVPNAPPIPAT